MGSLFVSGKIRYVFFGVHGVLVDSDLESYQQRAAEIFGCTLEEYQAAATPHLPFLEAGQYTTQEFWQAVGDSLKEAGVGREVPARKFKGFMAGMLAEKLALRKDMVNLCHSMKGRAKVGVLANCTKEHAKVLHKVGAFGAINLTILSCEIGSRMPDTGFFKRVLRLSRCAAKQCLFVDVDETLLAAAQKFGFKVHLFEDHETIRWELLQKGLVG